MPCTAVRPLTNEISSDAACTDTDAGETMAASLCKYMGCPAVQLPCGGCFRLVLALHCSMLCCSMLCCAVLCCAVLCAEQEPGFKLCVVIIRQHQAHSVAKPISAAKPLLAGGYVCSQKALTSYCACSPTQPSEHLLSIADVTPAA